MGAANRKVVLFVNNCPTHLELDNLRNIKLVFQPKNTTSMFQPLDQGIVQQVKLKFREMFEWSMVLKMEIGKDMKKWDVFTVMEEIVASWRAVQQKQSPTVSGMPISSHQSTAPTWPLDSASVCLSVTLPCDEETWQQLTPDSMLEEFVTEDDDITVWSNLDYTDDVQGQQESRDEEYMGGGGKQKNLLKFP
ncbi:hypothetical protein PR048_005120 [Dryococelus australis]|uniref:DDE-1 domain-containing protein n=1 Tax=Dryococelus australis TaxID=614101 RepID=A0ABQ9I8D8_9NEOP|nr:hypothetical protein PR048_005120 [Dryococelus australis]